MIGGITLRKSIRVNNKGDPAIKAYTKRVREASGAGAGLLITACVRLSP
jgi:hypothetical protein